MMANFWETCLGVVSVPEVSLSKFSILRLHVGDEILQQGLGKVLGGESGDATVETLIIEVGRADGECAPSRFAVLVVTCVTMYGE